MKKDKVKDLYELIESIMKESNTEKKMAFDIELEKHPRLGSETLYSVLCRSISKVFYFRKNETGILMYSGTMLENEYNVITRELLQLQGY